MPSRRVSLQPQARSFWRGSQTRMLEEQLVGATVVHDQQVRAKQLLPAIVPLVAGLHHDADRHKKSQHANCKCPSPVRVRTISNVARRFEDMKIGYELIIDNVIIDNLLPYRISTYHASDEQTIISESKIRNLNETRMNAQSKLKTTTQRMRILPSSSRKAGCSVKSRALNSAMKAFANSESLLSDQR